jgi:hypothetical protein
VPKESTAVQQEFVDFIGALEKKRAEASKACQQYDQLFSSLMQRAFNGELKLSNIQT